MSLTNDQLLQRIRELEDTVNEMQTAMNNLASKRTLNASVALKQQEINELRTRIETLESEIAILQAG